jgi:citrate synthase
MSDELNRGLEGITVAETRLSDIDGEAGELVIAGYPVGELARNATYEESVYLLRNDRLPTGEELADFRADLAGRRDIGEEVYAVLERAASEGAPAMDALRMGAAAATLGADDGDAETDALRAIAVFPTIVAAYWRYHQGEKPVEPREDLRHAANYLYMLDAEEPDAPEVRGLETYLNTVIDHGLNASTFTARTVVSTESDVVSGATAAVGTLKGPLHGGAPGPVLDMLTEIHESGDTDFFATVRDFEDVAVDILADRYPERRLDTNVEFYTAALLDGVGVPKELFTTSFAVSRVGGWMAHALEQLDDNRLVRPRSRYVGAADRAWTPVDERDAPEQSDGADSPKTA